MKITIAPSKPPEGEAADTVNPTVCVEHPYDDLNLEQIMTLVRGALIAYGFSESTVKGYFDANL